MPEDAAALLLAGLERRCGYCCVNTVHLQTRTLESLCLVYDSDMLLRLEPGEEETAVSYTHLDLLEKKGFYYEIYKSQYDIA